VLLICQTVLGSDFSSFRLHLGTFSPTYILLYKVIWERGDNHQEERCYRAKREAQAHAVTRLVNINKTIVVSYSLFRPCYWLFTIDIVFDVSRCINKNSKVQSGFILL